MRLWHSKLIPLLDGKRLCDLHMSCCNLRGNGWGKRNAAVGYLYEDPLGEDALTFYHHMVLYEMKRRGYNPDEKWFNWTYCGKNKPARQLNVDKLEKVYWRNVPLKGHTLQIYLNDVQALKERGLDIRLSCRDYYGAPLYNAWRESTGDSTTYVVDIQGE